MQDLPRRPPAPLLVRVTFEPSRLATEHLVAAYDQVAPVRSRVVCTSSSGTRPSACPEQAALAKEQA